MVDVVSEDPISLERVAMMLDVSILTVRSWTKPQLRKNKPVLPASRIGRKLYTTRTALQQFSQPNTPALVPLIDRKAHLESCRIAREEFGIDV